MDKKYGQVFKQIRTGRGLSLLNATGGHFSLSMLSRFENGQSEMSAEKLFSCLDNIYLSVSEYDYLMRDYKINDFHRLVSEIEINKNSNSFQKSLLEQLIVSEMEKIEIDGKSQYHKLNIMMIKAAIKAQEPDYFISNDEIAYLSDYLFSMDIWIEYELILFMSTYLLFQPEVLVIYCEEMVKRVEVFQNSIVHSNLVQTILLNISFFLIEHQYFDKAYDILRMFDKHFSTTRDAYMRMIYKLALGFYKVKIGHSEGKYILKETLDIMSFLGFEDYSDYYREQFSNIL